MIYLLISLLKCARCTVSMHYGLPRVFAPPFTLMFALIIKWFCYVGAMAHVRRYNTCRYTRFFLLFSHTHCDV